MCGCMKNKFGNPQRQFQNKPNLNKLNLNKTQHPVPKQGLRKPPPFFNQMVFLHNRNIALLKKNIKNSKNQKVINKVKNLKKINFV